MRIINTKMSDDVRIFILTPLFSSQIRMKYDEQQPFSQSLNATRLFSFPQVLTIIFKLFYYF